jgi:hypothetical protein
MHHTLSQFFLKTLRYILQLYNNGDVLKIKHDIEALIYSSKS